MAAAAAAGIGFVAQFMGLRGLPYPCSIAQIGAIIAMTLLRAKVRRHLGRKPNHFRVFPGYELDHLATRITFDPTFRETMKPPSAEEHMENPSSDCFFGWKVKLPGSKKDSSQTLSSGSPGEQVEGRANESPRSAPIYEYFLSRSDDDKIQISMSLSNGRWTVDTGKVEAVLSLWMAHMVQGLEKEEIERSNSTNKSGLPSENQYDWRRSKGTNATRHRFWRILGDGYPDAMWTYSMTA
ncbi:hypothetical protein B0I35DRAFT_464711 [Stachybotrys elegans]|uniref:Uncharacterized protein n=1 Tax=Stachybotrys elegans TaxID=80388 RepID=A0A8K0SGN7_9HYPO|nr:hypothetical protein B0I35DRAFT_464711 [Stachybotrys elegans]